MIWGYHYFRKHPCFCTFWIICYILYIHIDCQYIYEYMIRSTDIWLNAHTHTHVHKALKVCYCTAICKNSWFQFGKTHLFLLPIFPHLKFSGQWYGSKPFWTLGHGTRSSILGDTIPSLRQILVGGLLGCSVGSWDQWLGSMAYIGVNPLPPNNFITPSPPNNLDVPGS